MQCIYEYIDINKIIFLLRNYLILKIDINLLYLGRFHTFSSGFLNGKEKIGYNYTQIIQCTPNKEYFKTTQSPVHYLKQLYTRKEEIF
jgi:hypothetical protein